MPAAPVPSARRAALATIGPAFVAAVAYVDPGNFATNFAAGVRFGYALAWVIVCANVVATLVQYVTAKVGLATGRTLPELCRSRFGPRTNAALWVQAEVVAMATDLAEFVGAAVGLHLLFGLPLLAAGGITAVVTFAVLALEQTRHRRFLRAVIMLLMLVAGSFLYLLLVPGTQQWGSLASGLVPSLSGEMLPLVVGIVGATVMPHVIYAHSALQTRQHVSEAAERRRRLRLNRWDCIVGLSTAGLVNLSMLCVAAALPSGGDPTDLAWIHSQLATVGVGLGSLAFAVALTASGFASSSVGTYAGQVVMAGFVRRSVPLLVRRAITVMPALVVLALPVAPGQALVVSQIVLSFGIPLALGPLIAVSSDRAVMGDMVNRTRTTVALTAASAAITLLNVYLLADLAL